MESSESVLRSRGSGSVVIRVWAREAVGTAVGLGQLLAYGSRMGKGEERRTLRKSWL
jgi:hypothetical protein